MSPRVLSGRHSSIAPLMSWVPVMPVAQGRESDTAPDRPAVGAMCIPRREGVLSLKGMEAAPHRRASYPWGHVTVPWRLWSGSTTYSLSAGTGLENEMEVRWGPAPRILRLLQEGTRLPRPLPWR